MIIRTPRIRDPLGQLLPAELACRGADSIVIDKAALDRLQARRDALGKPLIIRSAYRSAAHKRAAGFTRHAIPAPPDLRGSVSLRATRSAPPA